MLSQRVPLWQETYASVALAGLLVLAVAMGVGRFAFTPLLPLMQDDAGLSLTHGGYLAAANYVGYLAGALWAARPARAGLAIRASLLAISLLTLAMGIVHGLLPWIVLRALAGVASAWALVYVSAWGLDRLAGKPGLAGVLFGGVGVGIALTGALCIALMSERASSSESWVVLGVVSLIVTAAIWPAFGANGGEQRPAPRDRYRWTADAWRLVLCYGVFGFGYIIPATFVPIMAKQAIADPAIFGWAWPIFGITAAASTLAAGPLLRVAGNRRVWIWAALAMAFGVASPLVLAAAGIVLCAVLVGGTFMVITMAGMQEARRVAGSHAAPLMAAMTAAFASGQIAGPLCVSYLGSLSAALAAASALLVLSALALAIKE